MVAAADYLDHERTTGNGHYVVSRLYPTSDVEVTAIRLETADKLKRGGGAKRQAKNKEGMKLAVLEKSVSRARTMVRRKCLTMQADRMLTLTFRENVTDLDEAWAVFKYFVKLCRWRWRDKWTYVAVPEFQKRGAVHFHLAIKGFYSAQTLRKFWHRAVGTRGGNIDITSPRRYGHNQFTPSMIAGYLAKYMIKPDPEKAKAKDPIEFNRRRYSSGGDIQIPAPQTGWLALGGPTVSIIVDMVSAMTRKDISQIKEIKGYFDILFVST